VVVDCQRNKRRNVAYLLEDFRRVLSAFFPFAEQKRSNQFAAHAQRSHTAKPYAGDVAGGAQERIAAFTRNALWPWSVGKGVNMLGQERKNCSLRKDNKTRCGNGSQHGRFFLVAKERA